MARLSQRELLNEGFGSMLRKAAGVAAGVGGAVAPEIKQEVDKWKGWGKGIKQAQDKFLSKDDKLDKFIERAGYIKTGNIKGTGNRRTIEVADIDFDKTTGQPKQGYVYPSDQPLIVQYKDGEWDVLRAPRRPYGQSRDQYTNNRGRGQQGRVSSSTNEISSPKAKPHPRDVGSAGTFGLTPQKKLSRPMNLADNFSQKYLLRQLHMLRG